MQPQLDFAMFSFSTPLQQISTLGWQAHSLRALSQSQFVCNIFPLLRFICAHICLQQQLQLFQRSFLLLQFLIFCSVALCIKLFLHSQACIAVCVFMWQIIYMAWAACGNSNSRCMCHTKTYELDRSRKLLIAIAAVIFWLQTQTIILLPFFCCWLFAIMFISIRVERKKSTLSFKTFFLNSNNGHKIFF